MSDIKKCNHIPGGYWEKNDPICAPLNQGGLNRPFAKCQDCGILIEKSITIKNGKSFMEYIPITKKEKSMSKKKLSLHEKIDLERRIRVFVKKDGGFRKGVCRVDKKITWCILKKLGRKKLEWDETIDLNMVSSKSKVRPKTHKNSID